MTSEELEGIAEKVKTLSPPEQLRLAASPMEAKRPRAAHMITELVVLSLDAALAILDIEAMKRGQDIHLRNGPQPQSVIHVDDICDQLEAMLGSAGVPPLVTNWASDEDVTSEEWCTIAGAKLGVTPKFQRAQVSGAHGGFLADTRKCRSIVGPCKVEFAPAFDRLIETYHMA